METSADSAARSRATSINHDGSARDASYAMHNRPVAHHSRGPSQHSMGPERLPDSPAVYHSAISRLQAQVSYNTGMLESHRRQFAELDSAVSRLHQEIGGIVSVINEVRNDLRAKPLANERPQHDHGDLEVIAGQLQRLTNRVNEIDGINMQMDLMRNRVKRLEEPRSAPTPPAGNGRRPPASSSHREREGLPRENSHFEGMHPQRHMAPHPMQHGHPPPRPPPPNMHPASHPPSHQPGHPLSHPPSQAPPQPHLPPMRTASMASPEIGRPQGLPAPPVLESQPPQQSRAGSDAKPFASDAPASHPPPNSTFRPADALPGPAALSGWRPAESFPPRSSPGSAAMTGQPPNMMGPDPNGNHNSGWAAVNANPTAKRPPEDRPSPYQSPMSDGSKRPKLAPLMPNMVRNGNGEDGHVHPHPSFKSSTTSAPADASMYARVQSDGSHPQPPSQAPSQHHYRFITSTQQADSQESWRPESDRIPPMDTQSGHGNGRGRGRSRGRGRGRGRGGSTAAASPAVSHMEMPPHATPEMAAAEWGPNHALPPNGYYNPTHPYSPGMSSRGSGVGPADIHGGGPVEAHADYPSTPNQHGSPQEQFAGDTMSNSGKKTRTKPIRNAEGILIRKDGRPDMRSVSSANNLRKVHAKKEAERAEMEDDEDQTRSGTPISNGPDGQPSEEPSDAQATHSELMSRMFPQNTDSVGKIAEQFFPRNEKGSQDVDSTAVKDGPEGRNQETNGQMDAEMEEREAQGEKEMAETAETGAIQKEMHMEDVVMQEANEAQAVEQPPGEKSREAETQAQTGEDRIEGAKVAQEVSAAS